MSLLEQKRLQWAAEKEEVSNEWNPWGRPGCGAPTAASFCSASTMVTPQHIASWHREQNDLTSSADLSLPLHISCAPSDLTSGGAARGTKLPPLPSASPPHQRAPSLNSSSLGYNNNNPFIYTYAYDVWKEEAKRQWLHELNKQREEQRLRRSPLNLPKPAPNEPSSMSVPASVPLEPATFVYASSSAESPSLSNFDSSASTAQWTNNNNRTFLRGANVPLDPSAQTELSLRRAKALEQQEAIRVQIEERKRVRERERAEEKRREMEEELRLAKETDHAPSATNAHPTYAKTLEKSEHKVAPPPALTAPPPTVKPEVEVRSSLPDVLDGAYTNVPKVPHHAQVAPSSVGTETTVVGAVAVVAEEYVVNRVLTPTKYRGHPVLRRDCATQTDFKSEGGFPFKKDASTCTKKNNPKDTKNAHYENRLKGGGPRGMQKRRGETHAQRKPLPAPPPLTPTTRGSRRSDPDPRSSRTKTNSTRLPSHSHSKRNQASEVNVREVESGTRNQSSRTRSRSSAEYQRTFIAEESNAASQLNQRRSVSPVSRANVTGGGDSSTCDDEGGGAETRGARRKRRQWESPPPRHLLPHFYTDSPPGRRRSLSTTSNSGGGTGTKPLSRSTPKIHTPETIVLMRTDSPPVPALRRLQLAQEDFNSDGTGSLRAPTEFRVEPKQFEVGYREDSESELKALLESGFKADPRGYREEPNKFQVGSVTKEFQMDPNFGFKEDPVRELLDSGLDENEHR